jgi:pilus assembly protein Flp/PilA
MQAAALGYKEQRTLFVLCSQYVLFGLTHSLRGRPQGLCVGRSIYAPETKRPPQLAARLASVGGPVFCRLAAEPGPRLNLKMSRLVFTVSQDGIGIFTHWAAGAQQGVRSMRQFVCAFLKDEAGATAIDYGLIAAGIAVVIIATVQGIGTNLKTTFGSVQTALK